MSNLIYLTLNGARQGLISSGCSSQDSIGNKWQINHIDKILIYSYAHGITREQNVHHRPVIIKKPIDKSSPLLGMAISDNEVLQALLELYQTNSAGVMELYYSVKLIDVVISDLSTNHPHTITHNGGQPEETLSLLYKSITWKHHIAGTDGYSIWDERVF